MIYINYYNEIKTTLIKNEEYKRIKDYSKNKSDLNSYFEVGRLLVEAQGGETRAKYGNKLIKEYSAKLTRELGKGYTERNLRNMRTFYTRFKKWHAVRTKLTWTHYRMLLPLKSIDEIKYYIYIAEKQNLSYRQLRERIKSNEYERIGFKEELEEPKINTLIKNPIIIKTNDINEEITEYRLHQIILENIEDFLKELGVGFTFVGHEVKLENNNRRDILLFNTECNLYGLIDLKVT
ncbi:MAG: DUF1016 family protein, partial [Bacilli bacterium]|nr:DUF1016 family protein [Bacilli bacterium]